jgi:predicted amidophosphoribosyltransferase
MSSEYVVPAEDLLTEAELESLARLPEDVEPRPASPAAWVDQATRLRATAADPSQVALIDRVIAETLLLDDAGASWSLSGPRWLRYDGSAWVEALPPPRLWPRPMPADLPDAPASPFDILPACHYCEAPYRPAAASCVVCGANLRDASAANWRCIACEQEQTTELECSRCGLRRAIAFPRDFEVLAMSAASVEPVIGAPDIEQTPLDVESAVSAKAQAAIARLASLEVRRAAQRAAPPLPNATDSDSCSNCGTPRTSTSRFCTVCGQQFASLSTSERAEREEAKQRRALELLAGEPDFQPNPVSSMPAAEPERPDFHLATDAPAPMLSEAVPDFSACQNCGAPLTAGARFCVECGTPATSAAPPAACRNCGATLAEGARFCVACGTAVA